MIYAVIALTTLVGSFIQAVTGFGAPVVMLMVFPHFFGFEPSVLLIHSIAILSTGVLFVRYFKNIAWRTFAPVVLLSLIIGQFAIRYGLSLESAVLTRALGFFFIALSLFFLFFQNKIHFEPTLKNGLITGAVAGLCNGFFGVGAPPLVLYFSSALDDKESYMACMQGFFFISNIQSIIVRGTGGAFENLSFLYVVIGWAMVLLGVFLGQKLFVKIETGRLKKIIYLFLALSGIWNIIGSY